MTAQFLRIHVAGYTHSGIRGRAWLVSGKACEAAQARWDGGHLCAVWSELSGRAASSSETALSSNDSPDVAARVTSTWRPSAVAARGALGAGRPEHRRPDAR